MYLQIGGSRRPLCEARVESPSYELELNAKREVIAVTETWPVTGRIVNGYSIQASSNAQAAMSNEIRSLRTLLLTAFRPYVALLHDDGSESVFVMRPEDCIEGPTFGNLAFPSNEDDIFATSHLYAFTVSCKRLNGAASSTVTEFTETLSNETGGTILGLVGGAINSAELQTFKENEPWTYSLQGSAVGLLGYPEPPSPRFPANMLAPRRITRVSPRVQGPVPMYYEIQWRDQYGSDTPLPDNIGPHQTITG